MTTLSCNAYPPSGAFTPSLFCEVRPALPFSPPLSSVLMAGAPPERISFDGVDGRPKHVPSLIFYNRYPHFTNNALCFYAGRGFFVEDAVSACQGRCFNRS
ncbi:MAG: hypothetical protein LBR29_05800 [Methylobacteriaceae bacterium]|jgi:hypothetical protein|nr:hypothetical protein [Methylobacteriaceae bacterium]